MDGYRAFYIQHKPRLFSYLVRMTGDYELAGDIMQESFTRHLEHYGKNENNHVALLYTIARNALFDHFRKQVSQTEIQHELSDKVDRERQMLIREEYRKVLEGLQLLEAEDRDIISLSVSDNLSYKDIAFIVGTSEANIKVRIHRIRVKLKKILEG
jgi:RNA polymerase sigma-70 factor (ECF subfamily)